MRVVLCAALVAATALAQPCPAAPAAPRGWNSWDADAGPVTEANILAAATWVRDNLLSFGFDTITIDGGWYSNLTSGGSITDAYGLPMPDPARFPSAAGGAGLLPLAKRVNAMGLKLGAWTIRGVTTEAFAANLPIRGSAFSARDVGVAGAAAGCSWDPHIVGTNAPSAAADAWYASLADHYVANGLEFVKVDCMLGDTQFPGHTWWYQGDVEAFAAAFAARAPRVAISWSPGGDATPAAGAFLAARAPAWARMYRVTPDFHDSNGPDRLTVQLETAAFFAPLIGVNGSYPDLDMLPFGEQADPPAPPRPNAYTPDEQRLIMTLWAIARAPLVLGAALPPAHPADLLALVANAAVLDVNARSCRNAPTPVLPGPGAANPHNVTGLYAWTAAAPAGDATLVALFNVRGAAANVTAATGAGAACVTDLWSGARDGALDASGVITRELPARSAGLWRAGAC